MIYKCNSIYFNLCAFLLQWSEDISLFTYVNFIRNLEGGSEVYVADLTFSLFVSDNTEIYCNVPQARLKFLNIYYQSDYPIAHTVSIIFNNCLSQIRQ